MNKIFSLIILLCFSILVGSPSSYLIKTCRNWIPVIDGNINEWPETALIDTLRGDMNVFARDSLALWIPAEFQMKAYAVCDSEWIYFAIKTTADDNVVFPGDNVKVSFGGSNNFFSIDILGSVNIGINSLFFLNSNLKAKSLQSGNGSFPTYEFAMKRNIVDPLGTKRFQASVGSDETDYASTVSCCRDRCILGLGVEYNGNKQDWIKAPWDSLSFYPEYMLNDDSIVLPINDTSITTHVFWYNCIKNGYNLTTNPGPALPTNIIKHEGMVVSAKKRQSEGNSESSFGLGNGPTNAGYCSFVWFKDLNNLQGKAVSAKVRGEYRDAFGGNPYCTPGPMLIRCGVVDYANNIKDVWGDIEDVPATAKWMDAENPLGWSMNYSADTNRLAAEKYISVTVPQGVRSDGEDAVLDKKFFEIDVTDQANWILSHTGTNKGKYSGQYGIVFLTKMGDGTTSKVNLYSDEANGSIITANPWTTDGNTIHLVLQSDSLYSTGLLPYTITKSFPTFYIIITFFLHKNVSLTNDSIICFPNNHIYSDLFIKTAGCSLWIAPSLAANMDSMTLAFNIDTSVINRNCDTSLHISQYDGTNWIQISSAYNKVQKQVLAKISGSGSYAVLVEKGCYVNTEASLSGLRPFIVTISNPSMGQMNVLCQFGHSGACRLRLYGINGCLLFDQHYDVNKPGKQVFALSLMDKPLVTGLYILRFDFAGQSHSRRVVFLR